MANEKRLIGAKHLSERIRKKDGIVACTKRARELFDSCYAILMHFLEEEPTVDAVEVVRCQKCIYYDDSGYYCRFWHEVRHPEHYCGVGERRNDNEDNSRTKEDCQFE